MFSARLHQVLLLIGALVAFTILCCGAQPPAKPKASQPPPPAKAAPANEPAATGPGTLVISPAAPAGSRLYNSRPLILSASLWRVPTQSDDKPVAPLAIKAKQGTWRETLVVNVKNSSGADVPLGFHAVKQDEATLSLGADDIAVAQWWLEPTQTQSIPAGDYTITVSFDAARVTGLPTGGQGIQIDNYNLRVEKEPSPVGGSVQLDKQLELARLATLKNDLEKASSIVDGVLVADPENIGGYRVKSAILSRQGDNLEAAKAIDKALNLFFAKHPNSCPPVGILNEQSTIQSDAKLTIVPAAEADPE